MKVTGVDVLNYIQDNLGWGLGFSILCISSIAAIIVFLSGIKTYRYSVIDEARGNPLLGITEVLVAAAKNWKITSSSNTSKDEALEAFVGNSNATNDSDTKSLLLLIPLSIICLIYPVVTAQNMTLFTKQSSTMDRSITIILFAAVYDRLFLPLVITWKPNGITMLQRIGTGMFFFCNIHASGLAIAFTSIGLQEFFYDQVANGLKSMGLALNTSVFGVGNFFSGFHISTVQKVTSRDGQPRTSGLLLLASCRT
ncbi:hypothetical protein C5167_008040 [Papaver somniferum]|uniref:Uncharacterized protein n=1 Tax=Papaver somniferum TaxID=3469 RepID=A0A4Y7JX93_PAPSO|nr:hypothetical protein C5167_008040 [Papaver somniferum]